MNETTPTPNSENILSSSFLPSVLLALALCFSFIYQLSGIYEARSQLNTQFKNINTNIDNQVAQSLQIQAQLERLARDLVALSANNKNAKAIVDKYGIKINGPVGQPAPAPAK